MVTLLHNLVSSAISRRVRPVPFGKAARPCLPFGVEMVVGEDPPVSGGPGETVSGLLEGGGSVRRGFDSRRVTEQVDPPWSDNNAQPPRPLACRGCSSVRWWCVPAHPGLDTNSSRSVVGWGSHVIGAAHCC